MTNSGRQEAVNQGMQGDAASELGDFASAATHYGEAAGLYRKLGDDKGAARTRDLQAELARHLEGQN